MRGYRVVLRDECGHERHVGDAYWTLKQAHKALADAIRHYGEECSMWVEEFCDEWEG